MGVCVLFSLIGNVEILKFVVGLLVGWVGENEVLLELVMDFDLVSFKLCYVGVIILWFC